MSILEGDRELTWLLSPSFSILPDATEIAHSSQDFRGVNDSSVGTPTTSVGDSLVGTS